MTSRRLAAILLADVVGYSRLMQADEVGTLRKLKERHRSDIAPAIAAHGGRIVNAPGDSFLVEFGSIINAVQCAVDIQRVMEERNTPLPADQRLDFRIGVNLGDVVVEGEEVFGDGVNLAARLEALCEPGGVCLSEAAYQHVRQKLPLAYHDMGRHEVKNFREPVHAYRISLESQAGGASAPLTEGPAILVLPFANMSGEAEQEFFADGLTEDILTELSRFKHLFVISRNSAFKFKGKAVDIRQVAREFKVGYVVEGSVRKAGGRVRVTVQLIDGESDRHIWAEKYDRQLEDIFAIQDEVTSAIVSILPGRVEAAANERVARKTTENMAAYECVLAGKLLHHRSNQSDNASALRLLTRAVELDPSYAHAHAWLACTLGQGWVNGYCEDRDAQMSKILAELEIALSLDDNDSDVHRIFAAASLSFGRHEKANYHQQRALSLNPNDDLIVVQQGEFLTWFGQPEDGVPWIEKAMRLNPFHPPRYWNHLGRALFVARRYQEAIAAFQRISSPDQFHHAFLAACHAQVGNAAESDHHAAETLTRDPSFTIESYLATLHYLKPEDRDHHHAA
ncbi:MAG: adenylate/guanylate cyclase domain-containing protein, partial [Beijerinckiaceae bacterium]